MAKIIIEFDDDFCHPCFKKINMFLSSMGFKMIRMKTINSVQVYKWVEKD